MFVSLRFFRGLVVPAIRSWPRLNIAASRQMVSYAIQSCGDGRRARLLSH